MSRFRSLTLLMVSFAGQLSGQTVAGDTAFQRSIKLDIPDASGFAFATLTVPTGKRLIIRYLTVTATLPSGQRFTSSVQASLRGEVAEFPQAYIWQSNDDGTDELVSGHLVMIQAEGDSTVYFQVFRRIPKGGVRVVFALSGDLVPAI